MLVAEKFILSLVKKYGKDTVYTDGGTWYDEACMHYTEVKTLFTFFNREKPNGNGSISI